MRSPLHERWCRGRGLTRASAAARPTVCGRALVLSLATISCGALGPIGSSGASAQTSQAETGTLVVLNKGAATATFIDVASGEMVGTLPTGQGPHELAMTSDGRWAVSTDYGGGNSLTVLDVARMRVERTIDLSRYPRPHGAFFLPGDSIVAVTSEASRHVVLVHPFRGEIVDAIPTDAGGSHMVAVTGDGRTLYTGDMQAGTVSRLDVAARSKTASFPVPATPEAITVSRDGSQVWVGSNERGQVSVVNAATGQVEASFSGFEWPYRILIVPEHDLVVIPDLRESGDVRFVLYSERRELDRLRFPGDGPQGVALSHDRSTLYLSLSRAGQVAVIDLASRRVLRRIDAGPAPDGIGWSPLAVAR